MTADEEQQIVMQLILKSGKAQSQAMAAITAAKAGQMQVAADDMTEAEQQLAAGHQAQTDLLAEASGEDLAPSLLMVHAQDHLSMAMMAIELGKEIIDVYKRLDNPNDKTK